MANENVPPKDLEVRLTELENAVKTLTQSLQPAAATTALSPQLCSFCHNCYHCFHCYHCYQCYYCGPVLQQVETGG